MSKPKAFTKQRQKELINHSMGLAIDEALDDEPHSAPIKRKINSLSEVLNISYFEIINSISEYEQKELILRLLVSCETHPEE